MDGEDIRRNRRGEELAKMAAASFALVLSSYSVCSSLTHHLKEENENEDEAGRMADCLGAALVLSLPVRSVHLLFPSLFAFVLSLYIIRYRYNKYNATN